MRVYARSSEFRLRFLCIGRIGANCDRERAILAQRLAHHLSVSMEPAQTRAVGCIEKEFERDTVCREPPFDFRSEAIKPVPASGLNEYGGSRAPLAFGLIAHLRARFAVEKVDLVPNLEQPSLTSSSDT